jgi:DNA polymerase
MVARSIILDCETRSQLDLRRVGAERYATDSGTEILCVGYAVDDRPVELWRPGDPAPPAIIEAAADPECVFVAHNAAFERAILSHILTPRYDWPEIPIARWRDTMSAALALALPAALDKVAKVLGLPQQKGDKSIVSLTAKPRRPRGDEDPAAGPYWFDDEEHLAALYAYCKQDVETERELFRRLPPLSPAEQELWGLDAVINSRGFYCDGLLIEKAIAISTAADRAVQVEIKQLTNGEIESTNQVEKIIAWLAGRGCVVEDLQKATLAKALRRTELSPEVRRVIELRREAAHASANKFEALRSWRCHDGRVRGCFKFHGAATGRWSGAGVQPQNLKKESDNTDAKFAAVMSGDLETVRQLGPPLEIAGDIARVAICAPPGWRLLGGDFTGIESIVLAWIADQLDKVEQWRKFFRTQDPDDDPYHVLGRLLGFPKETARKFGKIADLAFGYQGGPNAYKNFAPEGDTISDTEIDAFKRAWRDRHPQIVQFWYGLDRTANAAVARPGVPMRYGRLSLMCEQIGAAPFLFVTLPSGRRLSYPLPKLITNRFGRPAVEFADNALGQWKPCNHGTGCYGGMWTENIVQGIARDLLAAAMARLEAAGYPVVLHVHDEIVCELPNGGGSVDEFRYLITQLPEWAA